MPVAAAAAPASAASGAFASPPLPPPPFATVIKDAKKIEGLLTLWQKDEKVWLELKPSDFGKPFFLSPKLASGIGEPAAYGGLMNYGIGGGTGGPQLFEFRRLYNNVQLVARNTDFAARPNTPEGRAVDAAYSPSLLGSAVVASQPNSSSQAILIDVTNIFVSDMLGVGIQLQRAYRQGYALDARNSAVTRVRALPDLVVIEVQNHYSTATIAQLLPGAPPGAPVPSTPLTLPDARSLFVRLHYSISRLPDEPMASRRADPRVGYFDSVVQDFGDDLARTPKQRYLTRWRLEKKDPSAEVSEPVKPITFWIDRTVPLKYRETISAGILEWNKAFERIGFHNAIAVQIQPDDADFDTLDANRASVRWMTNSLPTFGAIGPKHVDPRSGEILDADIAIESLSSRSIRTLRSQVLMPASMAGDAAGSGLAGPASAADWMNLPDAQAMFRREALGNGASASLPIGRRFNADACTIADQAGEQLAYALDVLEARGEIDPGSPEAERFVDDYLKEVTIHEVGHALGLRHNFRSSRAFTEQQLADEAFTQANGLAGSIMDYVPVNLARRGEHGGTPFQTTIGPYDYWAIEYGYRPFAKTTPADESAALGKIASRSNEPWLGYGTDEDNFLGIDPESLQNDLGDNPLAFARRRFDIARDLLKRQESRSLRDNDDYTVLRRSIAFAVRDAGRAAATLARQIGGIRTLRDYPGSGRDPLQPVSPAVQREALDLLTRGMLGADSLVISPGLQRRLAPDYLERGDALSSGDGAVATDFPLAAIVLDVQRALLAQLMSDGVAVRILDSQGKASSKGEALRLSDLYRRLDNEVWSELGHGDIPALRRELQQEHANRLAGLLLHPLLQSRADARSLLRATAQALLARIDGVLRSGRALNAETRAHLAGSAETLRTALAARVLRAG